MMLSDQDFIIIRGQYYVLILVLLDDALRHRDDAVLNLIIKKS